ncbi:MAG: exodeoxyribonuclease VII large subunit [Coriobacteriales bacterium]|jgi:exodeoxyribonuclease VII large subunit|nr:exodeoxyribonuclease VII large subunit [Coriobacteriales bacterium]
MNKPDNPSSLNTSQAVSVSAALALAKSSLESINLRIVGEVSELSDRSGYKAVYFTITDQNAALPCLMWRNVYDKAGFALRAGMLVEVAGKFSLYSAKGRMNFDVKSLKIAGEGDLRVKVAELARKLEAEGLMAQQRKLPIPDFSERIGLVTSPRGKAVHDVLRTLRRRWPLAEVVFAGVPVEGAEATSQMIQGLQVLEAADCSVILLVRGGGSYEDLMPFNDEALALAIAASRVPIVTGIGHEPDTSIADLVADFRASTPTAAAERVSPNIDDLRSWLLAQLARLPQSLQRSLTRKRELLVKAASHPVFTTPGYLLEGRTLMIEHARSRLQLCAEDLLRPKSDKLAAMAVQLQALSPLNTLARGYTLTLNEQGGLVRSVNDISEQDKLGVMLPDGRALCTVDRIEKQESASDCDPTTLF